MRGGAHALGPDREGPSLTIGAGARTSLPTPRSVAPVRGLQSGPSPCHCHCLQQFWSKYPAGPFAAPPCSLRITLSSAPAHGNPPVGFSAQHPVNVPSAPPLGQSGSTGGAWGSSTLQTDLVGTCQTNERRCPLLAFRNSGNALGLARALGPCTQCHRSRRSGRSRQRSPWFMATGIVGVLDASVKLPMLTLRIPSCLHPACLPARLAGCLRHAARGDRSISADKRAVIPILQCKYALQRDAFAITGKTSGRAESESFRGHLCDFSRRLRILFFAVVRHY